MDPNGLLSQSSMEFDESVLNTPPAKELLKCSKEACPKKKLKKPRKQHTVAFEDEVRESSSTITGFPGNTNVKQIAQSISHLMDMMSRARLAKVPKISMTIKPRKTNLSQESDVTAVDAQREAFRIKTPTADTNGLKLLGGNSTKSRQSSFKVPTTSSINKMNRAKSSDNITTKRLSGIVKQIRCGPSSDALNRVRRMQEASSPMKVDQFTNEDILEYLRNRGKGIKSPPSSLKGSRRA